MKKKFFIIALLGICMVVLSGCNSKALEAATLAAETYNEKAAVYNSKAEEYNASIKILEETNLVLQEAIDCAQSALNGEEDPYDPNTATALKEALMSAVEAKVTVPALLPLYKLASVNQEAKSSELNTQAEELNLEIAAIDAFAMPDAIIPPDYTAEITSLSNCQSDYENSVQSMRQITAPTDEFVISRLPLIETIFEIKAVTEDYDINGMLGKQGGYIGCIFFSDNQVDRSRIYFEDGKDGLLDIGTDCGGGVEIFSCVEDAVRRDTYIGSFDGTIFAGGSHYVLGTCVVRTSNYLKASQQKELTNQIFEALLKVD